MWFKKVTEAGIDFLVEKEWDKDSFYVNVYFVLQNQKYISTYKCDSLQEMNEDFEETTESVCLEIYNDTKASLN